MILLPAGLCDCCTGREKKKKLDAPLSQNTSIPMIAAVTPMRPSTPAKCASTRITTKKAKDLDIRIGGGQQDGSDVELNTFGQKGIALVPVVGAFWETLAHADFLADLITDALTAEHPSYNGDRTSKAVKANYRRHASCLTAGASYKPRTPQTTKASTPMLAVAAKMLINGGRSR